ncbi:TIGR03759 family integrating conjugative element protein [bacterium endosymbiont of Escarpia laminata]|nr:MAG: TIGR03759 family integrating conjugative element protein [bacterium endosymbiont of Escarpia laminata]
MKAQALILLILLSGVILQADADTHAPILSHPSSESTEYEHSALEYSDRDHARQWHLTESEWQRYKTLMRGIRGSLSPATISPIEVLGIHAESEADRRKYAERWAQMMHDDTEQILAFQRAVIQANEHIYGDQPLIDVSLLPGRQQKTALKPGERLLFFTDLGCTECNAQLSTLLTKVSLSPVGLDIFLLGTEGRNEAARQWARDHGIQGEQVRRKTITINHDNGTLARLSHNQGQPPYLMRQSPEGTHPIGLGELW